MKKNIFSSFFILFSVLAIIHSQPPKPAEGFRWMLNEQFSDEFNGSELDLGKWYDYHPYWQGRPPAKFTPSQVSVDGGLLRLKNEKMEGAAPGDTWQIKGAAVVSKTRGAHFGYYECRQMASEIRMSSTFWMSNGNASGPDPCNGDRYSQELDIQEAVGGATATSSLSFRDHMHSNTHYWYTDCNGNRTTYSKGNKIALEEGEVSDTFHVYAAHWKNANSVDFYLNGKFGNRVNVRTDVDATPFERPMQINMVTETYDWITPPLDEDLADDSRNTTYIDWIRSWKLVDVDFQEETTGNLAENPGFETGNLNYWAGWGQPRTIVSDQVYSGNYAVHVQGAGAVEQVVNLRARATYTLSCYGKIASGSGSIFFGIKDASETVLGSTDVSETDWTKKTISFTTGSSAAGLKFYFYAPNENVEGWADGFELFKVDTTSPEVEEVELFVENLSFTKKAAALPANLPLEIPVVYQANGDREIHLQLRNSDSLLLKEGVYPALAGYGHKRLKMTLDPLPEEGEYILVADLRHADSATAELENIISFRLFLQNPVEVKVKVHDARDNAPLEGVQVQIRDEELLSDAQGLAIFAEVAAGSYALSLEKEGYDRLLIDGLVAVNDTLIELVLRPFSYGVDVQIRDAIDAKTIEGASVVLGDSSAMSNLHGTARFTAFAGDYTLLVSAPRFHDHSESISLAGESELTVEMLRSVADVKFVVKKDGLYLKDAVVDIAGQSGTTSSIGITFFSDIQTGIPQSYIISKDGFTLLEDQLELRTDSTVRINLGVTSNGSPNKAENIKLYPNPAGERVYVSGLDQDQSCTLLSVSGQLLRHENSEEKGSLNLRALPAGFYLVRISGDGNNIYKTLIIK